MKKTLLRRENLAKLFAEFLAVMFSGGIGLAADTTGISLILFPEIAALSFDVFSRPRGKWATQPLRLIITPTITAALGVIVTRHWEYGAIAITAITLLSLVTIKLLRSILGQRSLQACSQWFSGRQVGSIPSPFSQDLLCLPLH
jgi:hypothetical protein